MLADLPLDLILAKYVVCNALEQIAPESYREPWMSADAFIECLKNAQFKQHLMILWVMLKTCLSPSNLLTPGWKFELFTTCEETPYSLKGRAHCMPWTS